MIANYHTHTWRCNHAERDEEAYVQTAIAAGIKVLGFSDHAPQPFHTYPPTAAYTSGIRMSCDQVADYMQTLTALQEKHRGEIDIHIGFEAEYYPDLFECFLRMLEPWPCEYLILGQHFLGNEVGGAYAGTVTDSAERLDAYVEQCKRALYTGAFSCFAHPDLMHYVGDDAVYRRAARALCREAKGYGVPIEFNLLGFIDHRHYPTPAFWEEAAVVGAPVILGWDAHAVAWMNQPQREAEAMAYLDSLGLKRIDFLTLIKPRSTEAK